MSDQLIDVRTPLATSENVRIEAGADGVLHLNVGPLTLHLDRGRCEELTTTLARAMVGLARAERAAKVPRLRLVPAENDAQSTLAARSTEPYDAAPGDEGGIEHETT